MVFDDSKLLCLSKLGKPDKSRKGEVDEAAWPFINTINSLKDFYTTSSCAGRIDTFLEPASGKKHDAQWLFVTHGEAEEIEVLKSLESLPEETVWLRMEPPIFHVACRDLSAAERLLKVCQSHGFKRSGIISMGGRSARQQRVMLEVLGNERIDTPVAIDGKLLFDHSYIKFLVQKANEKLLETRKRLEELRLVVEKELS